MFLGERGHDGLHNRKPHLNLRQYDTRGFYAISNKYVKWSETKRSSCIKWATNHLPKGAEKDCTEKSHGTARIDAAIIPIKAGSRLIILRSVQPDMQLETFAKIGAIRTDLLREMRGESKPDRTNIWQGRLW